jgi:hypothetical protein
MALNLAGYRSFFNSTVYSVVEKMNETMSNPIFGLLGEQAHTAQTGDTVNFTSDTLSGFAPVVVPGGDIPETNVVEGDTLARTYFSIKDRMVVEYEDYLHNKLDIALERAEDLANRTLDTASLLLSGQLLNNANATTQTAPGGIIQTISTADTLALGSASHTVPGTGSTTYSNVLAGLDALSDTSLTSLEQQLKANNVDDAGTVQPFVADCLIVPDNADMIKKALQLTGSQLSPESNNNSINIYRGGRLDVVVLKHAPRNVAGGYSTAKQYYWALANKKALKRAIKFRWALRPTDIKQGGIVPKFMDKNLDSSIITMGRLVYGAPRWQGIGYSFSVTKPTTV